MAASLGRSATRHLLHAELVTRARPRDHPGMRFPGDLGPQEGRREKSPDEEVQPAKSAWEWLGVRERRWKKSPEEEVQPAKTAWDVLQLLIVPVMLVLIALYFNASQASRDRSREDRRIREDRALAEDAREDATLDDYIAKMSSLTLDRGLLKAPPGSAVRQVARTATLTTVRRMSGSRKGEVVRFLYEAGLLAVPTYDGDADPIIDLTGADLRGADLVDASLNSRRQRGVVTLRSGIAGGVALRGDLRGARFDHAYLDGANFRGGNLRGASFEGTVIYSTSFAGDDLRGTSFERAYVFDGVIFNFTRLENAVFDHATISAGTAFYRAFLDNASFVHTAFGKPGRVGEPMTSFRCATGRGVDFSHAVNLSSLEVRDAVFTDARMDGVKRRPRGWGETRTFDPLKCRG
jgi:uncharacterized protein YjbI with pentapeptide repeats